MEQDKSTHRKQLIETIRKIVSDGDEIRHRVADAVREAGAAIGETGETLADISKSVIDEAVEAASSKLDENRSGEALREVIEGVGDGLHSTAQAVDLAMLEARGKGREFADEDLGSVAEDLRSIAGLFVETTERALRGAGGHLKEQVSGLVDHAEHTAKRVKPQLESAASTVSGDAVGIAKQTARAGVAGVREGVGALLAAVGGILKDSGEGIKTKHREAVDTDEQ
ncbi:MAG: ElaB/YqjD/DUF883 family membrane-anchored ribosome-binding protein [Verrucomicrobiales bacterium]|jgi:ElaB/YqjD/DUF883 family membrane-anchored ribosome-binding protein